MLQDSTAFFLLEQIDKSARFRCNLFSG